MRLTHFLPVLHFYSPGKHQETIKCSNVYRGYRNVIFGKNGLMFLLYSDTAKSRERRE